MLKIGEFSKLSRVSVRMLRHYDEIGLLPPASIDSATGYRYYSEDQLPVAGRITALRDIGFGLGEIQACQQGRENPQVLAALFSARREALRGELAALQRQLRLLDTLEQRLRKEDSNMEYPVNLKTLPQRQVASVRMTIPAYDQEGILWHTLVRGEGTQKFRHIPPGLILLADRAHQKFIWCGVQRDGQTHEDLCGGDGDSSFNVCQIFVGDSSHLFYFCLFQAQLYPTSGNPFSNHRIV